MKLEGYLLLSHPNDFKLHQRNGISKMNIAPFILRCGSGFNIGSLINLTPNDPGQTASF